MSAAKREMWGRGVGYRVAFCSRGVVIDHRSSGAHRIQRMPDTTRSMSMGLTEA